jgi:hypothetical protein
MGTYSIARTWNGETVAKDEVITIDIDFDSNGLILVINAPFHNDCKPTHPQGSLWELWNYEVVELFMVGSNGKYSEFEFGPHGHYLSIRLNAPRSIMDKEHQLIYTATIDGKSWRGKAIIPKELLPESIERFNLFAIHGMDEHRRYLCYASLSGPHPDFHQPSRFPNFTEVLPW